MSKYFEDGDSADAMLMEFYSKTTGKKALQRRALSKNGTGKARQKKEVKRKLGKKVRKKEELADSGKSSCG